MTEHGISSKQTAVLTAGTLWVGGEGEAGRTRVCKSSRSERSEPNHKSLCVVVKMLGCILQVTGNLWRVRYSESEKFWVTPISWSKICQTGMQGGLFTCHDCLLQQFWGVRQRVDKMSSYYKKSMKKGLI